MTQAKTETRPGPTEPNSPTGCERLQRALSDCLRRIPAGRARDSACRHLNRSLAECLVSVVCLDVFEEVQTFCSGGGTSLQRSFRWCSVFLHIRLILVVDLVIGVERLGAGDRDYKKILPQVSKTLNSRWLKDL